MKNTKYLFDESKTPCDGKVSISQLQTFMSCPKKWEYNYVDDLVPRVERAYLGVGKLCHKGMQVAMQAVWRDQRSGTDTSELVPLLFEKWKSKGLASMHKEYEKYKEETPHLAEEEPEFERIWEDAQSVFSQAFEEFEPWKYEVLTLYKDHNPIPALELHFVVPCTKKKSLHGYIDAILRDRTTNFLWCVDYKFRKSLSIDSEEAFNVQNAVYSYACLKMGLGITGTMTWQHLNTPAQDPQILKNGTVSRSKIKTTWSHYKQFLMDHEQNPEDYEEEMIPKLADIEWFRSTLEYRNSGLITNIWSQVIVPLTREVCNAEKPKSVRNRHLYPWNCKMCQYQDLCQSELRNHDSLFVRSTAYTKRKRDTEEFDGESRSQEIT